MHSTRIRPEQIQVRAKEAYIRLIVAHDGELMSSSSIERCSINAQQEALSDPHRDILKIVVFNRYWNSAPSVAFIKGFGLKSGAMASSVAHDCHNIIAVGVEDEDISQAINAIIQAKGGISFVNKEERKTLALPVAGMMSAEPGDEVARQYKWLDQMAKEAGSSLSAPFMTLSFMALLVIPSLKISDKGLFDGEEFQFVDLFVKKA
jgi:adenine deaminase